MSLIKLVFLIAKLLELIVFIVCGNRMSKTKSNKAYWRIAIIPILTYGLIEGLRFGRKIDWNLYYFRYNNLGINMELEDYEPIFELICKICYNIGFTYPIFILLQCVFVIFSVVLFLSNHKNIIKWALPISLLMITSNENFIRFYMGFAFGIIGLYFTDREDLSIKKKYIFALLFAILGGLNHLGAYFFVILILSKQFLNIKAIPWRVSVLVLFLTTFVMSPTDLMFITRYTDFLFRYGGSDYHGAGYLDRTGDLLSGEFGHVGYMVRSIQTKIRIFIYCVPVFIYGGKCFKKHNYGYFYYNLFIMGAIVHSLLGIIEIFDRFSSILLFMGCISCSIVYMHNTQKVMHKSLDYYLILISIMFLFYPFINDAFLREGDENMMFIWNSMGRKFLKYW